MAFIGISNWALDPAKMNRGILLSRGVPTKDDLIKSAQGICAGNVDACRLMRSTIRALADGYEKAGGLGLSTSTVNVTWSKSFDTSENLSVLPVYA